MALAADRLAVRLSYVVDKASAVITRDSENGWDTASCGGVAALFFFTASACGGSGSCTDGELLLVPLRISCDARCSS